MSAIELKLIGKERQHYEALESLYDFCRGGATDHVVLAGKINETVTDWEKLMGGSTALSQICASLIKDLGGGNRDAARILYLYLSPIFFFVLALRKASRSDWRETVTACGVFCERVVRNLFQEIDRIRGGSIFDEMKDARFKDRYGRLMSELQKLHFEYSTNLFGSIDRIYTVRNAGGPHDVPPPEPIRAKISISECLPVYLDYLNALRTIGTELDKNSEKFLEIFSQTTRTEPALLFGEGEGGRVPVRQIIKDVLYREGFFQQGRTLAEAREELNMKRYNYEDSMISHALTDFCSGKDGILTKRKKGNRLTYVERIPPSDYFKKTL